MESILKHFSQFTKTRITLTLWYSFILLIILVAFTITLSITYNNDVTRIVLKQDFGNHVPKTLSPIELRLIVSQVRELRSASLLHLIIIDAVTLLLGTGLSYFLAGKTLSPIQKNMANQKLFVADASHELRSPITSIQSACEVVLRSNIKTKEDYKKVIEQVFDQSQRLGRLVNDLLLLSVLDTTSTTTTFHEYSLSELTEHEIKTMQPLLQKKKISITTNITPHVLVYGDADKIQQLVVILLDNAIKYTHTCGCITLSVIKNTQIQLIVEDTGIGIDHEKQKDIFRRFYQADLSHAGSGAGLGLAIASSIMQLHKGQISVKSTPNKGSTFICTFPTTK